MFISCRKDGNLHSHTSWIDLQNCVRDRPFTVNVSAATEEPKAAATGPLAPVSGAPVMRDPGGRPTGKQLDYIRSLGGSWRDAFLGTKADASQLIETLKDPDLREMFRLPVDAPVADPLWESFPQELQWQRGRLTSLWEDFNIANGELNGPPPPAPGTEPSPSTAATPVPAGYTEMREEPAPAEVSASDRLKTFAPMLRRIPEGYFAVDVEGAGFTRFFRVSRPTKGDYIGAMKVQSVHGGSLSLDMVLWPSGRVSRYTKAYDVDSFVLEIMTEPRKASRHYAKKISRCARCNTRLTDPRSRHYGIGPECEKHWPEYIAEIDLLDAAGEER